MSPPTEPDSAPRTRSRVTVGQTANQANEVQVPAFTDHPSPNTSEGSEEPPPPLPLVWSMSNLPLADETIGVEDSPSEENLFPERLVFIPFMKEPHVLNTYVLGKSPSKPFKKKEHVFKPTCKPEEEWISFSIEAAKFLSTNRHDPLDAGQFASLLLDNLSSRHYREVLSRVSAEKVFMAYQNRWYGVEEAARDYLRFHTCGINAIRDGEKFGRYYLWMATNPKGRVLLGLYGLSPQDISAVRVKHTSLFDTDSGALLVKDGETDKLELLTREVTSLSLSSPPRSHGDVHQKYSQSQSKWRSRDARQLPSASEWYKGKFLSDSLKGWNTLKGIPPRTFQAFVFPGDKSTKAVITNNEKEYRARYKLCPTCGNHLKSIPHSGGADANPFYTKHVRRKMAQVVNAVVSMNNVERYHSTSTKFREALPFPLDPGFELLADEAASLPLFLSCPAKPQTAAGTWEVMDVCFDTYCARSLITVPLVEKLALDVKQSGYYSQYVTQIEIEAKK